MYFKLKLKLHTNKKGNISARDECTNLPTHTCTTIRPVYRYKTCKQQHKHLNITSEKHCLSTHSGGCEGSCVFSRDGTNVGRTKFTTSLIGPACFNWDDPWLNCAPCPAALFDDSLSPFRLGGFEMATLSLFRPSR